VVFDAEEWQEVAMPNHTCPFSALADGGFPGSTVRMTLTIIRRSPIPPFFVMEMMVAG
jgi:hypothetical protein